ncbi:hypothetical protein Syun_024357 [Stephania yunnanensis]|uniref:Uncharacterized protein n=1 Tax=Stephania yunnanensis TaxID=152371 RepID=A0AAP0I476_9MAGN
MGRKAEKTKEKSYQKKKALQEGKQTTITKTKKKKNLSNHNTHVVFRIVMRLRTIQHVNNPTCITRTRTSACPCLLGS